MSACSSATAARKRCRVSIGAINPPAWSTTCPAKLIWTTKLGEHSRWSEHRRSSVPNLDFEHEKIGLLEEKGMARQSRRPTRVQPQSTAYPLSVGFQTLSLATRATAATRPVVHRTIAPANRWAGVLAF